MVTVHGDYVQFRYSRPQAANVYLADDNSSPAPGLLRMLPDGKGAWVAVARLPSGRYRFRYRVDGQWSSEAEVFGIDESGRQPAPSGRLGGL